MLSPQLYEKSLNFLINRRGRKCWLRDVGLLYSRRKFGNEFCNRFNGWKSNDFRFTIDLDHLGRGLRILDSL